MEMGMKQIAVLSISRQPCLIYIMIDKKQLEYVENSNYLGSMVTNDATCTCKTKSSITMIKAAFNKKKVLSTSKLDFNIRNKTVKSHIRSSYSCGAETRTLRKVDQKHVESFKMWCWRRIEKIHGTDRVRNAEVLQRAKK
jgi:hypothetical protein